MSSALNDRFDERENERTSFSRQFLTLDSDHRRSPEERASSCTQSTIEGHGEGVLFPPVVVVVVVGRREVKIDSLAPFSSFDQVKFEARR